MEQDFKATRLEDEAAKLDTATMYLSDDAFLGWRRRSSDIERGLCTVDTWEDLKKRVEGSFLP